MIRRTFTAWTVHVLTLFLALQALGSASSAGEFVVRSYSRCIVDKVRGKLDQERGTLMEIEMNGIPEALPHVLTIQNAVGTPKFHKVNYTIRQVPLGWLGTFVRTGHETQLATKTLDFLEPGEKYNYVILDDRIAVAKAGKNSTADYFAKHSLLRGTNNHVHYAGELWIDAEGMLHINNSSGTFAPDGRIIYKVADIITRNLNVKSVQSHPFIPGQ